MDDTSRRPSGIAFPAAIYGRLDAEQGFSRLQASADELPDDVRSEIGWFALRAWGAKPPRVDYAIESIGHFQSRVDPSLMHVLCVRPLADAQPVRAVVTVPLTAYRRFGCNPFAFAKAGFFEFLVPFMADPRHNGVCSPATGTAFAEDWPPECAAQWDDRTLAAAMSPLLEGESRVIATSAVSHAVREMIETIVWAMPIDLRSRVTVMSFAFIESAAVPEVAPALIGIYDRNAPLEAHTDGFGEPTSRAMTAIFTARGARDSASRDDVTDGRLLHLHELIRELHARVDALAKGLGTPNRTSESLVVFEHQFEWLRGKIAELHQRLERNESTVGQIAEATTAESVVTSGIADRPADRSSVKAVWAGVAATALFVAIGWFALMQEAERLSLAIEKLRAEIGLVDQPATDSVIREQQRLNEEIKNLRKQLEARDKNKPTDDLLSPEPKDTGAERETAGKRQDRPKRGTAR